MQLQKSGMISIHKKGDLSLPSSQQGIKLSSTVNKVISRMILNRIQPKSNPENGQTKMSADQKHL